MKYKCILLWLVVITLFVQCGLIARATEGQSANETEMEVEYDWASQAREIERTVIESYLTPEIGTWIPFAEGDARHLEISASGDWCIKSCPDWIDLFVLMPHVDKWSGITEWKLEAATVSAQKAPAFYAHDVNLFMKAKRNDSREDRQGQIVLELADGRQGIISVMQAQYIDSLDVDIVSPCADAADFVIAGYKTDIEVKMSHAVMGRIQILDAEGEVLYSENFSQEEYSFEYVFEAGCYAICVEAVGETEMSESADGYVCKKRMITARNIEIVEGVGVTRDYVEYVKAREGKRNKPYKDIAGYWTIGYGHLIDEKQAKKYAAGWSDAFCEEQLLYDLKVHAELMRERLGEELYSQLTPNQFDALVSMEFNGCGRAVESTYRLGRCLNKLDTVADWEIINGFVTWHSINNGTVDVLGLYYRRLEEARMFLYGDYSIKSDWAQPWWLNIEANGKGTSIHDVPSGSYWYTQIIPKLELNTTLIEASEQGEKEYITMESSRSWSLVVDESTPWITASNYRGRNGDIIEIQVAPNEGTERRGYITVNCGATVRTIHVHQNGLVGEALTIQKQPESISVNEGERAYVSLIASGEGLSYEWYYAVKGSEDFIRTDMFDSDFYYVEMNAMRDGWRLYCVVTDKYGKHATTNIVSLNMTASMKLDIVKQPESIQVIEGERAEVAVEAVGEGLSYEWYYAPAGSLTFKRAYDIEGSIYSAEMSEKLDGQRLYCVIFDKYGNKEITDTVTLHRMIPLHIIRQPESVTVAKGEQARVSFEVEGKGLSYEWYYAAKDSNIFSKTNTFKSNTYQVEMSEVRDGRQIYCVISDEYGNQVTTDVVSVNMSISIELSILKQPESVTVAEGENAYVSVEAMGEGLIYEWYYAAKGSNTFSKTSTFKSNVYQVEMNEVRDGRRIYCVITDRKGNRITSDIVSINMVSATE